MKKFFIFIISIIVAILILVIIAPSKSSLHNKALDIYTKGESNFLSLTNSFDFCFQYYSSTEFIIHYDAEKDSIEAFIIKEPIKNSKNLTNNLKPNSFQNILNISYEEILKICKEEGIRNINIKNGIAELYINRMDDYFYRNIICYGYIETTSCSYNLGYSRWCGVLAPNYFIRSKPVIL